MSSGNIFAIILFVLLLTSGSAVSINKLGNWMYERDAPFGIWISVVCVCAFAFGAAIVSFLMMIA